jgi:hypothetical protein
MFNHGCINLLIRTLRNASQAFLFSISYELYLSGEYMHNANVVNSSAHDFKKNIDKAINALIDKPCLRLVYAFFMIHYLLLINRKMMNELRKNFEKCQENCEGHCQAKVYEYSKNICSALRTLQDLTSKTFIFKHLKHFIDQSIDDWDDLVEDSYIGSDKEFRELIGKLAGNG